MSCFQHDNFDVMDLLSALSTIMQLLIYEEQKNQLTNDDLMQELQKQNKAYLEKIIANQKEIISKLNKLA